MCVCLPTYNERENLEPMLRALGGVLGGDDRVLVIENGEIVRDDPRDSVDAAQVSKFLSV